jgi:hypothetical protein
MSAPPRRVPDWCIMGLTAGLDQLTQAPPLKPTTYVDDRDVLALHVWNGGVTCTLCLWARVLDLTGVIQTFQWTLTPSTSRAENVIRNPLISGFLLSVGVFATSGTARRGQVWAVVALERTFPPAGVLTETLVRGYLTATDSLNFPFAGDEDSVESPGMILSVAGTAPSAGAEISFTLYAGARWNLNGAVISLTTSSTSATRTVQLLITDGTNTLWTIPSQTTQAQSLTYTYYFAPYGFTPTVVGTNVFVAIPFNIPLMQGWKINTSTSNIQAGDQYAAPRFYTTEWIEP